MNGVTQHFSFCDHIFTRLAVRAAEHAAAEALVRRRYAERGYRLGGALSAQASGFTLLAQQGARLLGTLRLRPDSPTRLMVENTHGESVAALRDEGAKLGEIGRLALEEGADWSRVLDALVQAVYLLARSVGLSDLVIEVNPRHVGFYRRGFGFAALGEVRHCAHVGAPSVLMRLPLARLAERLGDWRDQCRSKVEPGLEVDPVVVGEAAEEPGRRAAEPVCAEG